MNRSNIKKLTFTGVLIGIFVVLGSYLSINAYNIKITFQNLPLFIGAILYGPIEGFIIGFIGMLICQLLSPYGFTYTTFLWCMPQATAGAILGFVVKKYNIKVDNSPRFWILIIIMHLIITVLNTIVIYMDSKIMGYYSFVYVFGSFVVRVLTSMVVGVIYACILPIMIRIIKSFMQ